MSHNRYEVQKNPSFVRSAKFLESLAGKRPNIVDFRACSALFQSSQCDFNRVNVYFPPFYKVTYQNYESFWKFILETSLTQNCLMVLCLFWIGFDFCTRHAHAPCTCAMHTRRRCQCQIQSHCVIFLESGSEKLWTWLNVIDHNFVHYWTYKIIIFAPRWGNAPSIARHSRPNKLLRKHHNQRRRKRSNTMLCRFDPREHEGKVK